MRRNSQRNGSAAENLKAEIISRSTERKQKTIEQVWRVLSALEKKGVRRFTVSVVGRALEEEGILQKQSIWNESGADYRALIDAFAIECGAISASVDDREVSALHEALNEVKDLDARIRLKALIEDNRNLKSELNSLRMFYKRMQMPGEGESIKSTTPARGSARLPLAAIERFLSEEWVDEANLRIENDGSIYSSDGMPVAPPNFVTTLKDVLDKT